MREDAVRNRQGVMRWRTFAFIAVPFLAVLAAAAVFLPGLLRPPAVDVDSLVARLDAALAGGHLSTAGDEILTLRVLPEAEDDLLRVMRRAMALGAAGGDYEPLWSVASSALGRRPGSARIRAAAAYAALRTGRLAEAEKALGRGALPPEVERLLRGEAALRRGAAWAGADGLTRNLAALEASSDPLLYEATARRAADPRISLDAALLAMGAGNAESARSIVDADLGDARWDDPAAAILYDAGDGPGALERLRRLMATKRDGAEAPLLAADVLQSLGRTAEAEAMLARSIAAQPNLSWIPYADLAHYAAARGELDAAGARLVEGLAHVPRSRELSVALARVLAARGERAAAEDTLTALLRDFPGDVDASLLLLELQAARLSPEAYRARLWKLYNLNPADAGVLNALTAALVAVHDWQGLSIALRQGEAAGGAPDGNQLQVKGMAASLLGDYAGAVAFFQRAAEVRRDGIPRYNMALALLGQGNTKGALASLDAAVDEHHRALAPASETAFLARVMQVRGEALMLQGKAADARTALERSLALDPGNLRASLLLRKLAAASQ